MTRKRLKVFICLSNKIKNKLMKLFFFTKDASVSTLKIY